MNINRNDMKIGDIIKITDCGSERWKGFWIKRISHSRWMVVKGKVDGTMIKPGYEYRGNTITRTLGVIVVIDPPEYFKEF